MARAARKIGSRARPYVVMVRMRLPGAWSAGYPVTACETLKAARAWCIATRKAWHELTGWHRVTLTWYIIDIRDGTCVNPFLPLEEVEANAKESARGFRVY